MTCPSWEAKGKKIVFKVNPGDMSFDLSIRGSTSESHNGTVFFFMRRGDSKTYYNYPRVTYTFQTGNIRPIKMENGALEWDGAGGIDCLFKFLSIVDEQKIYNGKPNYITIEHKSALFPYIKFTGFFDPQETYKIAETPGEPRFSWTGTFYIVKSQPEMNNETFANFYESYFKERIEKAYLYK